MRWLTRGNPWFVLLSLLPLEVLAFLVSVVIYYQSFLYLQSPDPGYLLAMRITMVLPFVTILWWIAWYLHPRFLLSPLLTVKSEPEGNRIRFAATFRPRGDLRALRVTARLTCERGDRLVGLLRTPLWLTHGPIEECELVLAEGVTIRKDEPVFLEGALPLPAEVRHPSRMGRIFFPFRWYLSLYVELPYLRAAWAERDVSHLVFLRAEPPSPPPPPPVPPAETSAEPLLTSAPRQGKGSFSHLEIDPHSQEGGP